MFSDPVLDYAPWSHSKEGVLDHCLLQFHKKHVANEREAPSGTAARVGTAAHAVLEDATRDPAADLDEAAARAAAKTALTTDEAAKLRTFLPTTDRFRAWLRAFHAKHGVRQTLVEAELGINKDFAAVPYAVDWKLGVAAIREGVRAGVLPVVRGKLDLGLVTDDNALVIVDHKSGRPKPFAEYEAQLNAYAVLGAAAYDVDGVQTAVHHVETGDMLWSKWIPRATIEASLRPWLAQRLNRHKHRLALLAPDAPPPPRVGWYCGWCGFVDGCAAGKEEAERRRAEKARRQRGHNDTTL